MCDRLEQVEGVHQPGSLSEEPEDEAKAPGRALTPARER
jgi:hypothetical protein